jgi:hypothetical protein
MDLSLNLAHLFMIYLQATFLRKSEIIPMKIFCAIAVSMQIYFLLIGLPTTKRIWIYFFKITNESK